MGNKKISLTVFFEKTVLLSRSYSHDQNVHKRWFKNKWLTIHLILQDQTKPKLYFSLFPTIRSGKRFFFSFFENWRFCNLFMLVKVDIFSVKVKHHFVPHLMVVCAAKMHGKSPFLDKLYFKATFEKIRYHNSLKNFSFASCFLSKHSWSFFWYVLKE